MKLLKFVFVFALFLLLFACPPRICGQGQNNPLLQKQADVERQVNEFQLADRQAQRAFDRARQNLGWKSFLLIFGIRPRPSTIKIADDWSRYDKLDLRRHIARGKVLVALEETKILAQKTTGKEKEQFNRWRKEIEKKLFASQKPSRSSRAGLFFSFA